MSLALSEIAIFSPDKQTVNNHNPDILIYFNICENFDCMICGWINNFWVLSLSLLEKGRHFSLCEDNENTLFDHNIQIEITIYKQTV